MIEDTSINRVSSKDVAKAAGVSQSTVSRVFSEKSFLISRETQEQVIEAAKKLGYQPSMIARSLSKKSTKIIGIEMNMFNNSYYTKALGLFSRAFQELGYNLMLFNSENAANMEEKLQIALQYQVAGLILTTATLSDDYLDWSEKCQTPIFMFNRISNEKQRISSITGDNYLGGQEIGNYFTRLGLKRLAYIAGDRDSSTNYEREKGFSDSLSSRGLDYLKIQAFFTYQAGYEAAQELCSRTTDIEAVFCSSDSIALGFMDYIRHNTRLKIPADLSIIGYDNIDEAENINYQLTTYAQPLEELVQSTVEAIIEKINGSNMKPVHLKRTGKIVIRKTCQHLKEV